MSKLTRTAYGLDSGPELDWRQRGACTQSDPDLWTSPDYTDLGRARWVCLNACPVIEQCRRWAQAHPTAVDQAVYGGVYWTRRVGGSGNSIGVPRPVDRQPVPVDPHAPPRINQPTRRLEEQIDVVRALVAAGVTNVDIGRSYGCSVDTVRAFLRKHEIRRGETSDFPRHVNNSRCAAEAEVAA